MVYVVDLDDTLVLTKNLNNDAYNFALEQNGQKRIRTAKRLTRENLNASPSKKLITDKQNYFAQKWLKYRVVVNQEILSILRKQNKDFANFGIDGGSWYFYFTDLGEKNMDVTLLLKIAGVGLLTSVLCQVLKSGGREEQAGYVVLGGIIVVLLILVGEISHLINTVRNTFGI